MYAYKTDIMVEEDTLIYVTYKRMENAGYSVKEPTCGNVRKSQTKIRMKKLIRLGFIRQIVIPLYIQEVTDNVGKSTRVAF